MRMSVMTLDGLFTNIEPCPPGMNALPDPGKFPLKTVWVVYGSGDVGLYFSTGTEWSPLEGDVGPAGPAGIAATVAIGTVATGAPSSGASVVNVGTSAAAVLNFSIPSGVGGATGGTGSQGVRGSLWTQGAGVPTAAANVDDMYLDTATSDVWQMT